MVRKMTRKWEECKGKKTRMLSEDNISRSKQFSQMLLKGQVGEDCKRAGGFSTVVLVDFGRCHLAA